MNKLKLAAALSALLLSACGQAPDEAEENNAFTADAERIVRENIIVDGHIDVPFRLAMGYVDVTKATNGGDFDYPRASKGGLNAPFMSIYTPATLEAEGTSFETAEQLIDMVNDIAANAPDKFAVALSPADVRRHFEQGIMSLPMGMENGSPIEGDLANVAYFHERGIRYITLAHSLSNHISDSSYDENRQWNGLSDFGRDVVQEMNRLGIMIDISHVSDEAFEQVIELSTAPVIASHSSARHFTPGWERNMSDDMIRTLGEHGGVIMINYGSAFISDEARQYSDRRNDAREAWVEEQGVEMSWSESSDAFNPIFAEENGPYPYASLEDVLDHFDHVVALVGVDSVGIGSDYDGVGDSLPTGLKDVSSYPNLVAGLLSRGYSEADIRKILGENLLRVWSEVERVAAAADQATTSSST